jgi:IclR family acetate operon transcriptional repressor
VAQDPVSRAYLVADALVRNWLPPSEALVAAAKPEMRTLARSLGETTHLAVRYGTSVTLVASVDGSQAARNVTLVGTTFPAHFSAAGKVLLAELPFDELCRIYATENLRKTAWKRTKLRPEGSATIWDELLGELKIIRKQGFATNFRSGNRGINAIACGIRLGNGSVLGALVVSASRSRTQRRRMLQYAPEIERASVRIAARLEGR